MALKLYGEFLNGLLSGTAARRMDISADTIRVTLHTSAYTFSQDTHNFFDDVSASELPNGSGYTQGGITLAGKTLTLDASFNGPLFDANDISWPTFTATARHAIGSKWTGSAATSPLIFDYDFQTDVAPSGATFQIQWNPAGIFVIGAQ
jgi:hypothetical protein